MDLADSLGIQKIYLNFATGFNIPPYWLNRPVKILNPKNDIDSYTDENTDVVTIDDADDINESDYLGNLYQCPLKIKWADESEYWTLPFDPVISVSGKNLIVRRNVLKQAEKDNSRRGTIKEVWSQDDYEVNIAGVLMGKNSELPEGDLRKLRRYCEARKLIEVQSDLFTLFNINRLAIESFELPFTKGIENQMYTIKAYSDDNFDLLVKEEKR